MNREEIKSEISKIVYNNLDIRDTDSADTAEKILQLLEDIGFDSESSYLERMGYTTEQIAAIKDPSFIGTLYKQDDPRASWNQPK